MSTTIERPPTRSRRSRRDVWLIAVTVFAVTAAVVVATVALVGGGEGGSGSPAPSTVAPSQPTQQSAAPSPSGATASQPPSSSPVQPAPRPFGYQPLWPFANLGEVGVWQQGYRSGGHSPWHLDADATALAFTTGYLGFAGINVVVWHSITGDEALVAVGYPIEGRAPGLAAVLHLARYGSGADAPWEVVGSKDTNFTLTRPPYGSKVSSPVTVGGRITGVDESILVQVRQPSSPAPIGQSAWLPAGGENTPWSTTVAYSGATDAALTIVASTGGHYTDVERFAITGVRP